MSKVRQPFKPPRIIKRQLETEPVSDNSEPTSEPESKQVQWRKKTLKKNKTWDGDGSISINQNEICLKNSDGKVLTKKSFNKLPNFDEPVSIGNFEFEIDEVLDIPIKKIKPQPKQPVIKYDSPNAIKLSESISIDPILSVKLRPHQVEGVKFLYQSLQNYSGCLLADEMGLGKTLTTITTIWTLFKQARMKKFIIVCPVTLINNWKNEFKKWLGNKLSISNNEKQDIINFGKLNVYQVLIINYEKLTTNYQELSKVAIDLLICDEGHRLKNSSSKVLQNLINLNVPKKIVLTGTPIQNELLEFYTLVNFLNPEVLPDLKTFQKEFINPINRSRDLHCLDRSKGEEASEKLVELTSKFILRRTQEIMNHLTKKMDILLFVPPTSKQVELMKFDKPSIELIHTFRKICNSPALIDEELPKTSGKIKIVIPLLIECINQGEKIVLISNYTSTLNLLEEIIQKLNFTFLRLDGSTPNNLRNKLVQQFNKSNIHIFLLSSKSGGMGINLVGASRLILFDNDWNPSVDLQSLSRIHRDGQEKPCFLYRIFTTGCIDEKIFQRQLLKLKLSSRFLGNDKDSINDFDYNDLKNLFEVDTTTESNTHDLICDCDGKGETIEYKEPELTTSWITAADFKDNEVKKSAVKLALNDYCHYKPENFKDDPVLKNIIGKAEISYIMVK